jgi:hypothetical protein
MDEWRCAWKRVFDELTAEQDARRIIEMTDVELHAMAVAEQGGEEVVEQKIKMIRQMIERALLRTPRRH